MELNFTLLLCSEFYMQWTKGDRLISSWQMTSGFTKKLKFVFVYRKKPANDLVES